MLKNPSQRVTRGRFGYRSRRKWPNGEPQVSMLRLRLIQGSLWCICVCVHRCEFHVIHRRRLEQYFCAVVHIWVHTCRTNVSHNVECCLHVLNCWCFNFFRQICYWRSFLKAKEMRLARRNDDRIIHVGGDDDNVHTCFPCAYIRHIPWTAVSVAWRLSRTSFTYCC